MTNDVGIYNWIEIFSDGSTASKEKSNPLKENTEKFGGFGEYHSNKIEIRKTDSG